MIILYWAFGLGGAILFVLVPILGTIASVFRNHQTIKTGEPEAARNWRNAAANAGIATISSLVTIFGVTPHLRGVLAVIVVASLAAALSDTLSHELGAAFGGTTRLITSFRKVSAGVNGAVSAFGSFVAVLTALIFPVIAAVLNLISPSQIFAIALSAIIGNVVDSILGATVERRGWIGNNLVNLACVLSASIFALFLVR